MKYFSNASWSKIKDSQDDHVSIDYAQSICDQLLNKYGTHGYPCEVRGTCLKTWVTDENGKVIENSVSAE